MGLSLHAFRCASVFRSLSIPGGLNRDSAIGVILSLAELLRRAATVERSESVRESAVREIVPPLPVRPRASPLQFRVASRHGSAPRANGRSNGYPVPPAAIRRSMKARLA